MIYPTISCNSINNVFVCFPEMTLFDRNGRFSLGNIVSFLPTPISISMKFFETGITSFTHSFHMFDSIRFTHSCLPSGFGLLSVARTLGNFFNATHLFGVHTYVEGFTSAQKTSIINISGSQYRHNLSLYHCVFIQKYTGCDIEITVSEDGENGATIYYNTTTVLHTLSI